MYVKKVLSVYHKVSFTFLMQSTECPDKERKMKKILISIFLSRGLTYQKREICPPVEYKLVQLKTVEWE